MNGSTGEENDTYTLEYSLKVNHVRCDSINEPREQYAKGNQETEQMPHDGPDSRSQEDSLFIE